MITATYGGEVPKKVEDQIVDLFDRMFLPNPGGVNISAKCNGIDMAKPGSDMTVKGTFVGGILTAAEVIKRN